MWVKHQSLRWNDVVGKFTTEVETYSTEALRSRIVMTTQCAMNSYPGAFSSGGNGVYQKGHFIFHTAGIPGVNKTRYFKDYWD